MNTKTDKQNDVTANAATDLFKRMHNTPSFGEVASAINAGLDAQKKADGALAKLVVGVYHAFSETVDDNGGKLINYIDALSYAQGAGKDADEAAREAAKGRAEEYINLMCGIFSPAFNSAHKLIEESKGKALKDSEAEAKLAAKRTIKAVKQMYQRATLVAVYLAAKEDKPSFVGVHAVTQIRQAFANGDGLNASVYSLETLAREMFPKAKERAPQPGENESEDEDASVDAGATLLGSLTFIKAHVTRQNFAAQSKDVRELCKALFLELLPVFKAEIEAEPVLIKKQDKKSA